MTDTRSRFTAGRLFRELLVLFGYLLGAIVFTYPLATDLGRAVTDVGDPLLDTWAIAWVAHQLPRDPSHLFDANRYYPETGTLAFTDPMLAISIPISPVQYLFDNPVLTLNVAMLLTLAISGYGAYRLGRHLSGSALAGGVAGSVFAFNPYRLSHLPHVNLQAAGFIPLLFLCIGRYLEEGRRRHALGVGVFLWLVAASCAYYGLFTWTVLAVAIPYEIWRTRAFRSPRRVLGLGLAVALSAAAFLPVALPLMRLGDEFGMRRPIRRVQRASARPHDYLRSDAHLHRAIGLEPPALGRTLFPGLAAVGLGLLGLAHRRRRIVGLYLLVGAFATWASLGPAWGLYGWLHAYFPGISGLRAPPRYTIYLLLALAALAALGTSLVLRRLGSAKRIVVGASLVVLPLAESYGGPRPYTQAPGIPEVYAWLAAREGPTPIVELPIDWRLYKNAIYLYWSTTHFKPMANGYSTLVPPVFTEIQKAMETIPDDASVALLRRLGFRYVILHRDLYLRSRADRMESALDAQRGLEPIHRTAQEVVYEVTN